MSTKATAFFVFLAVALGLISQSAFIVPETKQVIVLQIGDPKRTITTPGLYFKIPFLQDITTYESRVLNLDPPSENILLAGQKRLVVDTFARYKITDVLAFYQALGRESEAVTRLSNNLNSAVRDHLGKVSLTDILSEKRSEVMADIHQAVNDSVARLGVEFVDVRIGRADFPDETSQQVFDRMRSEREREAAEFRAQGNEIGKEIRSKADRERSVLLAEAKKQAQIIRGHGEEQSIKIYADAYKKDPAFYEFKRLLEAYEASLANGDTTFVLSPDSEFFKFFEKSK